MRRKYGALLTSTAVLNVKFLMFISNSSCTEFGALSCLLPKKETGSRILLQPFKRRDDAMQQIMSLKLVIK
jgi:hypothetical protein